MCLCPLERKRKKKKEEKKKDRGRVDRVVHTYRDVYIRTYICTEGHKRANILYVELSIPYTKVELLKEKKRKEKGVRSFVGRASQEEKKRKEKEEKTFGSALIIVCVCVCIFPWARAELCIDVVGI